jgi:PIN domain nuclease of toxin-antitoxin system
MKPCVVLDASALIAYLKQEKGYKEVSYAIAKGAVSLKEARNSLRTNKL